MMKKIQEIISSRIQLKQSNKIILYNLNSLVKSILGIAYYSYIDKAWRLDLTHYNELQECLFTDMYNHAIKHVPYYRNLNKYPCYNKDKSFHDFLKNLPLINKNVVRQNNKLFVSEKKEKWCTIHTTSGTTGAPITLYSTPLQRALSYAILTDWYKKITGCQSPFHIITLSGFMTPNKKDDLCWSAFGGYHLFLNMYALSKSNSDRFVAIMKKCKNGMFFGYASALAELARVVGDRFLEFKDNFVAVSTSEILTTGYRDQIELHISRKVYDQYGSQEGSLLALECNKGYMHIHPYIGLAEILNEDDKPCKDGELGRIVVTGFNRSMPLIRYEIGDTAMYLSEACPCGLSWPIMGHVEGRSEDLVLTPDGRRIGYLNFHSTKNLKGIAESQLIQNNYKEFTFRLVLASDTEFNNELIKSNELLIQEQIESRLGYNVRVDFQYLKCIPREGIRNKFKAVVVKFKSSDVNIANIR